MIAPDEILRFKFDDVYHGFAECTGILRTKENSIAIEYVVKDSIFGVIKSNVKTFEIKYDNIIEAEFINKMFKKKLIIKPSSLLDSHNFPASESGEIHISLKRDKPTLAIAERITSFINLRVAEARLAKYDR